MIRNVMLATIGVALLAAAAGAAALLPEILDKLAGLPPNDGDASAAVAVDAAKTGEPGGRSPGTRPSPSAAAGTTAEWAETMFTGGLAKDFGVTPFGTRLSHRFEIKNVHAVPVKIFGTRVGCGCVTATPGKRELQPGESTTIDVTLDTRQFIGPETQTIRVTVGPAPVSTCVLQVSAVSRTDVVLQPDRIAFDAASRRGEPLQSMDVQYHGALDWRIEDVIIPHGLPLEAKVAETSRRPGTVAYRLDVAWKHGLPRRRMRDYIYLKTNQPDAPPVPVLVTATSPSPPRPVPMPGLQAN